MFIPLRKPWQGFSWRSLEHVIRRVHYFERLLIYELQTRMYTLSRMVTVSTGLSFRQFISLSDELLHRTPGSTDLLKC